MIESTLQLKPYAQILKQLLIEEEHLSGEYPKKKLGFPIIFSVLNQTRYIEMVPNVSYNNRIKFYLVLQLDWVWVKYQGYQSGNDDPLQKTVL